ncbi:Alkaline phosphatase [Methanocaldococcus villosus KIN24-T80]|uniref:Alkaline phosphatase n=1 Tax=Methanocaldococcus villosus KIN24-T80 TaxID=1069083 RepID=N6UTQ7_9EURY|nr:alkaline phosphatase [Methanocaldococcus villosus]ENN95724.1 Alkaline phosphatase [Methanocaldococcus villosus KIN24-T80]
MKKISATLIIFGLIFGIMLCGCVNKANSEGITQNTNTYIKEVSFSKIGSNESKHKVKNVILLIGDGMGVTQAYIAERYKQEVENGNLVILTKFKNKGLITTYSESSEITDSAAAGTALLSGYKTYNGMINMKPDGSIPKKTLGELAKKMGKSVGIVTTTRITHATPASVYAHVKSREEEDEIAEQLLEFEPTVAFGGGLEYFIPKDMKDSKRKDNKNLIEEFKKKGYVVVFNKKELENIDINKTNKIIGLFAKSHMAYEVDRENIDKYKDQPSLAEMTEMALKILEKNPKGFFLMVEGGRIDHACHAHDAKSEIMDTIAFDNAVKVALDFQKKHPDTLIVVTADHETAGMSVGTGTEYYANITALKNINASIEYMIKEISKNSTKENILRLIKEHWGIELTDDEKALLFKKSPTSKINDSYLLSKYPKINKYVRNWAGFALSEIESRRAHIGWASFAHTAVPVPVYAIGPNSEIFNGFYDNTEVPEKIKEVWG